MQTYAPIALFVFNRPKHTKLVLEALSHNPEAILSDLHIFSDGCDTNDINYDNVLVLK